MYFYFFPSKISEFSSQHSGAILQNSRTEYFDGFNKLCLQCILVFSIDCRWRRERISNKTLALGIESEIYNYAKSNLAIINIFIKEPYSKRFRKTEKMSRIAYIASSGGLLGLCMGFSFVSLAEILYHCFICVSIFFKKSSKSTHMMKDLYVTRNSSGNIRK